MTLFSLLIQDIGCLDSCHIKYLGEGLLLSFPLTWNEQSRSSLLFALELVIFKPLYSQVIEIFSNGMYPARLTMSAQPRKGRVRITQTSDNFLKVEIYLVRINV